MVLMLAILLMVATISNAADYCSISTCQSHTMCTYTSSQPSSRCTGLISTGLSDSEKSRVVNKHNHLRQRVASGQESKGSPGPQPAAENMPNLEWDTELETIAQKWANQCNFAHDQCRDTDRFRVGQNIAYMGTSGDVNEIQVESMVQDWYDEVKDFNSNNVHQFRFSPTTGHYTQLVWSGTTKIGCGATKYNDGGINKFYLVCNYGPAGNMQGSPMYTAHNFHRSLFLLYG